MPAGTSAISPAIAASAARLGGLVKQRWIYRSATKISFSLLRMYDIKRSNSAMVCASGNLKEWKQETG